MPHDRIINQHQPGVALYPRNLSYDLIPLVGPAGWSLLRALHDHADEQAMLYRGARPIAPSSAEMEALAGVGEASLLVIKELLRLCGCLSWEDVRGKQEPRPGRRLKQAPTRSLVYYLHPLAGLTVEPGLVQRVLGYALRSDRAQAYLKANGMLRLRPAFLPTSAWPALLPWMLQDATWQELFQRVHGRGAHRAYQDAAERWLESAAEVVATLEWEQQPLHERDIHSVHDRAVMVKARWFADAAMPSPRGNGALPPSHCDSALAPHTPRIESTNQPTGGDRGCGLGNGSEGPGTRDESGHNAARADAVGRLDIPSPQPPTPEVLAQAEAALWAELPAILGAADAFPTADQRPMTNDHQPHQHDIRKDRSDARHQAPDASLITPHSSRLTHHATYLPTRSEQRQARRLLRNHAYEHVLHALRTAVAEYQPEPGQPDSITRFGFATGLPCFRAALSSANDQRRTTNDEQPTSDDITTQHATRNTRHASRIADLEPDFWHELQRVNGRSDLEPDFWHELERVNGRTPKEAERARLGRLAGQWGWRQLLVWIDRWECAHPERETTIAPAYFEACAAMEGTGYREQGIGGARDGGWTTNDERYQHDIIENVGDEQRTVQDARRKTQDARCTTQDVTRNTDAELLLAGLGIRKARKLAALPATTVELVEAWAREAERHGGLKDKAGFVAAGVESGEHPERVTPFQNSMWAPVVRMPAAKDAVVQTNPHLELWDKVLARLSTLVDPVSWETWLAPTHLLDIIDNIAVVGAPNVFARDEVQRRYVPRLATALSTELGRAVEVEVVIGTLVPV